MNGLEPPVTSHHVLNPESLTEAICGARLAPLQLGARPLPSAMTRMVCPNVCLDLLSLGPAMLFTGAMPPDRYTLSYVIECPGSARSFNFATDHTDGYMGLFPPGGMLDAYTPAGMSDAILTVPVDVFRQAFAVYFPGIPESVLERGAGMRVGTAEQKMLRKMIAAAYETARVPESPLSCEPARRQFEKDLLVAFIAALRSGCAALVPRPKRRLAGRYTRLRRARDFLREHCDEAVHLDDLAAELHLSVRGVESLFHDLLGVPPSLFLRHHRLHGVRRALMTASPGSGVVKAVALSWGFWHMGHFAYDYRMLFGESPSATLARGLLDNGGRAYFSAVSSFSAPGFQ